MIRNNYRWIFLVSLIIIDFSTGNIFPAKDLQENDLRTLIVSSPNDEFIKYLYEILQMSLGRGREVKIGSMKFKIDSLDKLIVKLPDTTSFCLITGTPIIVRIPKEKYKGYDFEQTKKEYDYVYWRSEHPIDTFITQLENNLLKKYAQYQRILTDSITRKAFLEQRYLCKECGKRFSFNIGFEKMKHNPQGITAVSAANH
jgi:CRISPR-associated endoribonuclease Cas6